MATSLINDTHGFIEDLKAAGFSKEQAEGLTRTLNKSDLSNLATKADLKDLELRLTNTLTNRFVAVVGIGVAVLALIKFF